MSLGLQLMFVAAFVFAMILMGFNFKKRKRKIIFFGDSITEFGTRPGGYIALISEYLKDEGIEERFEWAGSGRGGDKVYDLVLRLEQDILLQEPRVVVLFIGVNDIWHKQKNGTGTSIESFQKFYEVLLQRMNAADIKLIACTPAVIGENAAENEFEWQELAAYGNVIKQLAATYAIPVVDLHEIFKAYYVANNTENIDEGVLTTDGVHLNVAGNKLVAGEIWKVLKHVMH